MVTKYFTMKNLIVGLYSSIVGKVTHYGSLLVRSVDRIIEGTLRLLTKIIEDTFNLGEKVVSLGVRAALCFLVWQLFTSNAIVEFLKSFTS